MSEQDFIGIPFAISLVLVMKGADTELGIELQDVHNKRASDVFQGDLPYSVGTDIEFKCVIQEKHYGFSLWFVDQNQVIHKSTQENDSGDDGGR